MSWVWAATNVITARPVALKFLKRPAARATDHFRRFIGEARATIQHRNVVQIYDLLFLEGDIPFMVMELLRGGTLRDELRRKGRLSLEAAGSILGPVVSALGCAHAAGIIHCDLKSENIFLAREDDGEITVKVLDFGLAKQLAIDIDIDLGPIARPRGGAPFGTVGYAAPEQGISSQVDHRADIWALGVVLFECLTGERPFPSDGWERYLEASSGAARARKRLLADGSALQRRVALGLPASVAALVDRMLSPDPSQRPSLREIQAELQRHAPVRATQFGEPIAIAPDEIDEESTVSDSDPRAPEPSTPSLPSLHATASAPSPLRPPRSSWRASRVGALCAAALALASAAGLLFLRSPEPDRAILPEGPVKPDQPRCRATIIHPLSDLEALAGAMPLTVEACSGPRRECVKYQVTLSPFDCEQVDSTGIEGVNCEANEIEKRITIRREIEGAPEGCAAWTQIAGHVRDKHRERLPLQLDSDVRIIDPPRPGVTEEIVVTGRFQR
jgi:serine/threonine-protein kinase